MQRMMTRLKDAGLLFAMVALIFAAAPAANAQQATDSDEMSQIALTDQQVKGYIKVAPKLADLFDKVDQAGGEPDKKLQAQLEAVAKEGGFKSFDELELVAANVTFVMSGINEEDGTFTEPKKVLEEELQATKDDKTIQGDEKQQLIASIEESIKLTPKLKYPGNVDVIRANLKALIKLFQE